MIKTVIKIPIYYGRLIVIVNDNFNESLKSLGLNEKGDYNSYLGLSHDTSINGRTIYIILLNSTPTHSIIAHEALHITHAILKNIQAKSDIDNDETTCYLLDWIVEQVYICLKKNNIEVSIKDK